jgi:cellulose synthase/poly-beta-1,6-N-acetylglucosamine synthase-like glycosyltransferase
MPTPTAWLDLWFVASAILIWFMIAYQFALFVAGLIYSRRFSRRAATAPAGGWPGVSIVVPARNEARVIAQTIQALTALDYPADCLDITIVDDGSTDATPEIVAAMAANDPRIRCFRVPSGESGQGKASALNRVFPELKHDLIAIYDADNRPEPPSLRRLVAEMVQTPRLAAAVGKFRTLNRDRTLLTRFINIEGLAFQWIVQAGRCAMLGVTTLPGTNFVIRRTVLEEVGGWDRDALTEDAELSIRIYETGRRIRFVPHAVTWEQEPERLGIWFKQRRSTASSLSCATT